MAFTRGRYAVAMDPVSGFKVRYRDLKRRWDGIWVWKCEWDPKHPQLTPKRHIYDPQALEHPWTDNDSDGGASNSVPQLETVFPSTFQD